MFTSLLKFAGQPVMTVLLHWHNIGLPIGLQLVGSNADEPTMLQMAIPLSHKVKEALADNL